MSERTDLKGRVALVTGSSAGIGAAVAQAFADLGASVVVNSASSVAAGQQVADDLPDAIYVQADVSDPAQAERLVDAAVEQYGRLDIVVNNAGTTVVIPHHDLDAATNEIWERILRVNVLGTWNMVQRRRAAPAGVGRRRRPQHHVHRRRPSRRFVHPVRSLQGGAQPPHAAARQRPRSRDPRPRRGPRSHRHRVDRELGRRTRGGPGDGTAAPQRHAGRRRGSVRGARRRSLRDRAGAGGRWWGDAAMTDSTFDRDDPPVLGANPFVGLTGRQVVAALGRLGQRVAVEPGAAVATALDAGAELLRVAIGRSDVAPERGDRRFADAAWHDNPFFHRLMQAYLVERDAAHRLIDQVELDDKSRVRAHFAMSLLTEAVAPTNNLVTNPNALAKAGQTRGQSLVAGARNFAHDVRHNGGMPSQVDTRPFAVGKNLAVTPGHVVHRTDVYELIQYERDHGRGAGAALGRGPAADQQVLHHRPRARSQPRREHGGRRHPLLHVELAQPDTGASRLEPRHVRRGLPRRDPVWRATSPAPTTRTWSACAPAASRSPRSSATSPPPGNRAW